MNLNKNWVKNKLTRHPRVFLGIRYIYTLVFHNDRLMRHRTYGDKNQDVTILLIRPNSEDEIQGLMSLLIQTLRWIDYANKNNYIPVVDYLNYKTQYSNSHVNAWENFFRQPGSVNLYDTYKSSDVILSGVTMSDLFRERLFTKEVFVNKRIQNISTRIIKDSIAFSDEVECFLFEESKRINICDHIGVYVRGTDYIGLKPAGEYRQPDIYDVVHKIREYLNNYPNNRIFLVTEDGNYFDILNTEFPGLIDTISNDRFIYEYDGKDYLSKANIFKEGSKERGIAYLVKIVLLSKCRYLISSITMGSIIAYCFNGGQYDDQYIFDLGCYS